MPYRPCGKETGTAVWQRNEDLTGRNLAGVRGSSILPSQRGRRESSVPPGQPLTPARTPSFPSPVPERTHPPGVICSHGKLPSTWIRYTELHTKARSDPKEALHQGLPRVGWEEDESNLEGQVCLEKGDSQEHLPLPHQKKTGCTCLDVGVKKRACVLRYLPHQYSCPTPDTTCLISSPCPTFSHVSFILLDLHPLEVVISALLPHRALSTGLREVELLFPQRGSGKK